MTTVFIAQSGEPYSRSEIAELPIVDHFAQLFTSFKEGNFFRGYVHGIPRFRIASFTGIAVSYAEAAKTAQLDLIALAQRFCDAIEEDIDNDLSLFLREIYLVGHIID
jgi:hypothetical protein